MERPKIIAVSNFYNNVIWVNPIINYYKNVVDELIVCEGRDSLDGAIRSSDGTLEAIKSHVNKNDNIRLCYSAPNPDTHKFILDNPNYDIGATRYNTGYKIWSAIKKSRFFTPGNWILLTDSDMFVPHDILKTRTLLTNNIDYITFRELRFFFNFNTISGKDLYLTSILFRITPGMNIHPILTPIYKNRVRYVRKKRRTVIKDTPVYHYSYLKTREELKLRFVDRAIGNPEREESIKFHKLIRELTIDNQHEHRFKKNKIIKAYLPLVEYEGKHPTILKNHPWFHIKDVREIS